MITWVSTGSYTDSYPVSFGGIQAGEFPVLEELANQNHSSPIHLIVIKQRGQKKEEKMFAGKIHVHRVSKPYSFKRSTDTEFRTAFAIKAKEIVHRLLVDQKTQLIQLCSAVPARCFLEWDMLNSFDQEKRLGQATISLSKSYQGKLPYQTQHLLGGRLYQAYLESKSNLPSNFHGSFYQRDCWLEHFNKTHD